MRSSRWDLASWSASIRAVENAFPMLAQRKDDTNVALFKYKSVRSNAAHVEPVILADTEAKRPDLRPPKWTVTFWDQDALAPGYWFVAPYASLDQFNFPLWNGPHIYDGGGELIWSGVPTFKHYNTFDFRTVDMDDRVMLSLIYPHDVHRAGVILNDRYEVETTVDLLGDARAKNMHEFTIVDGGKRALTLTTTNGVASPEDAAVVGREKCAVTWNGFKELDVSTSAVLYEWNSEGHIRLDESTKGTGNYTEMCGHRWDINHFNSADKFPDGDYLISARHTDTIYKVSHTTHEVVWRLGGVNSDFAIEPLATFTRQHDARAHAQNQTHTIISLLDNAVGSGKEERNSSVMSRGLYISLDMNDMTARLLQHYDHPNKEITDSRGSLHFLPNGNAFLGWTYGSLISENSHNGTLLMKASLMQFGANSYRAYKLPWVGRPSKPPDVYVSAESSRDRAHPRSRDVEVFVSWNGATEVATWNLFRTDAHGGNKNLISSTARTGFETKLDFVGDADFIVMEARTADNQSLGMSDVKPVLMGSRWLDIWWFASLIVASLIVALITFFVLSLKRQWSKSYLFWLWRKPKEPAYTQLDDIVDEEAWADTKPADRPPEVRHGQELDE